MTKEQEEKFEEWYQKYTNGLQYMDDTLIQSTNRAWIACLEANGIGDVNHGHFVIDWESRPWASEVRIAYASKTMGPNEIGDRIATIPRPIPAWKPADGEAVLTRVFDHAETGYVKGGFLYVRNNRLAIEGSEYKPFDESRLGWLWSDI